jgi:hypothetical protein
MVRVSPPELAREFPGPQASISVTFASLCANWSADHPPNAPAPTTITEAANAGEPTMCATPTTAEPFKKLRRELFVSITCPSDQTALIARAF